MYTYINIYIYKHMHTYIYVHTYVYLYLYIHIYSFFIPARWPDSRAFTMSSRSQMAARAVLIM